MITPGGDDCEVNNDCLKHKLPYQFICLTRDCNNRYLCRKCNQIHDAPHYKHIIQIEDLKNACFLEDIDNNIKRINNKRKEFQTILIGIKDHIDQQFEKVHQTINRTIEESKRLISFRSHTKIDMFNHDVNNLLKLKDDYIKRTENINTNMINVNYNIESFVQFYHRMNEQLIEEDNDVKIDEKLVYNLFNEEVDRIKNFIEKGSEKFLNNFKELIKTKFGIANEEDVPKELKDERIFLDSLSSNNNLSLPVANQIISSKNDYSSNQDLANTIVKNTSNKDNLKSKNDVQNENKTKNKRAYQNQANEFTADIPPYSQTSQKNQRGSSKKLKTDIVEKQNSEEDLCPGFSQQGNHGYNLRNNDITIAKIYSLHDEDLLSVSLANNREKGKEKEKEKDIKNNMDIEVPKHVKLNEEDIKNLILLKSLETGHDLIFAGGMTYISRYNILATAGSEGDMILWDIDDFKVLQKEHIHDNGVSKIKYNNELNILVTSGYDSKVNVWKVENNKLKKESQFTGHKERIFDFDVIGDKKLVISGDKDGQLKIWDPFTGAEKQKMSLNMAIMSLIYGQREKAVFVGKGNGEISVYNVDEKGFLISPADHVIEAYKTGIPSLAWIDDKSILISGGQNGIVKLWSYNKAKGINLLFTCKACSDSIRSLASIDDDYFLCSYGMKKVKVFSIANGTLVHTLEGVDNNAGTICYIKDKPYIIIVFNKKLGVWVSIK